MRERPILFSAPMVRALLDGTKTQTRKGAIISSDPSRVVPCDFDATEAKLELENTYNGFRFWKQCPYGQPCDRLWVKEKHAFLDVRKSHDPDYWILDLEYSDGSVRDDVYVDGSMPKQTRERGETGWRSSIHMPRWASRINLEITGVRVERLQDISEQDATAEGIKQIGTLGDGAGVYWHEDLKRGDWHCAMERPYSAYRALWKSLNGADSWDANPWVWVVEFKKVESK